MTPTQGRIRLVGCLGGVDDSMGDPIRIPDNHDLDRITVVNPKSIAY